LARAYYLPAVFSIAVSLGFPVSYASDPSTDQTPAPLTLHVGPVTLRPLGFVDIIGATRSATTHDDISTRFGSFPLAGGTEESVVSPHNSRAAISGEIHLGTGILMGYLETDFLNRPPQQPYRFRQYFGQYSIGGWDFSAGQEWSLLRPDRAGISSIYSMLHTRVVDAGYHVGLLGYRDRQVRVVRHLGDWQVAASFENGHDFLPKIAHDSRRLHWELIGVAGAAGHHGASASAVVHATRKVDLVTQQSWVRNGGKDALNAEPSDVSTAATLEGVEAKLTQRLQVYGYAGLVYGGRSAGNRQVHEWTLGFTHPVERDRLGPSFLDVQFSQLDRALWSGSHGAMRFAMVSYRHYLGQPQ
jgi:hypothetical protein